jgi:hypothetical protein
VYSRSSRIFAAPVRSGPNAPRCRLHRAVERGMIPSSGGSGRTSRSLLLPVSTLRANASRMTITPIGSFTHLGLLGLLAGQANRTWSVRGRKARRATPARSRRRSTSWRVRFRGRLSTLAQRILGTWPSTAFPNFLPPYRSSRGQPKLERRTTSEPRTGATRSTVSPSWGHGARPTCRLGSNCRPNEDPLVTQRAVSRSESGGDDRIRTGE